MERLAGQRILDFGVASPVFALTFDGECAKILMIGLISGPHRPSCGSITRTYHFIDSVPRSCPTFEAEPYITCSGVRLYGCFWAGEGLVGAHLFLCGLGGPGLIP